MYITNKPVWRFQLLLNAVENNEELLALINLGKFEVEKERLQEKLVN